MNKQVVIEAVKPSSRAHRFSSLMLHTSGLFHTKVQNIDKTNHILTGANLLPLICCEVLTNPASCTLNMATLR